MEIRDFFRIFIKNDQSVLNSLDAEVIKWMLSVQLIDNFGNTPVHHLAKNGNVICLKILAGGNKKKWHSFCKHYYKVNDDGLNPLHLAIIEGKEEVINFLLQIDLEKLFIHPTDQFSIIDLAIATNKPHILKVILQYIDAANDLRSSLLMAAALGYYDAAKILIESGNQNINAIDPVSKENIFLLSLYNEINWQWLGYLLDKKISIHQRNHRGLAIADIYFKPNLFYVGWVNGGKTHKSFCNLLWPHIKLGKVYLHHAVTLLLLLWYKIHQHFKALKVRLPFFKGNPPLSTPPLNAQAEVFRKAFTKLVQLNKQYNNTTLALSDKNSQGNVIYGEMTQRVLASRGMMPAGDVFNDIIPNSISSEEFNADIPDDLLPEAYKKNS